MKELRVRNQPISALMPSKHNARTHSKKQVRQIADSIAEFGFTNPVLVDRNNMLVAGHGRVAGAKLLGWQTVPTICLEELSEAQIRAYIIADNKLAENAGWDVELLGRELEILSELSVDIDPTVTGFELPEIDLLISGITEALEQDDPADAIPPVSEAPPVSRLGDLWKLGRHRLICGDSLDDQTYKRLLDGKQAQMVFTDPPYNVPIEGHVSGLGAVKHREFAMAVGEMSATEFAGFLTSVLRLLATHSCDGSIHYICMDWRHLREVLAAGEGVYSELKNICIWAKTNGGMGSLYRSKHELVLVYKAGTAPHINNVQLGKFGRDRTNVWIYAGANSFGAERDEQLAMHPTVKPVALVADAILDCSKRGGIVLDAFAGSGTTIIAAERTGRRGYAIELDPRYVDIVVQRYQKLTGEPAIHADSGLTFDTVAGQRAAASDATDNKSAADAKEVVDGAE